jgi:hypothetical protein
VVFDDFLISWLHFDPEIFMGGFLIYISEIELTGCKLHYPQSPVNNAASGGA